MNFFFLVLCTPPLKTGTFSLTPTVKIFPVAKLFCEPFDYQ